MTGKKPKSEPRLYIVDGTANGAKVRLTSAGRRVLSSAGKLCNALSAISAQCTFADEAMTPWQLLAEFPEDEAGETGGGDSASITSADSPAAGEPANPSYPLPGEHDINSTVMRGVPGNPAVVDDPEPNPRRRH